MRQPFYNVYAYCRHADDIADLSPSREEATTKLIDWRRQLADCFSGAALHPIFVALKETIEQFDLVMEPFDDLISAFLQDQTKLRYKTHDELIDYCRRSANPVGRIVLKLAGAASDDNVLLSDSICTGLQLANHWQDLQRDFQAGRVYLPSEDAGRFGVDLERLGDAEQALAVREMVQWECDRAEKLLRSGLGLANQVPRWLAKDIRLIGHGGISTLDAIRKIDYRVMSTRPVVSRLEQVRLVVAAFFGCLD